MASQKTATADDLEEPMVTAPRASSTREGGSSDDKRKSNAFHELMKPKKPKLENRQVDSPTKQTTIFGRDGLGQYTLDPASFPSTRVVYFNDDFVVINDLYPKASVHLLILPRDPLKNLLTPQTAFDDPAFLALCRGEELRVRNLVAEELRRKFGKFSASEQPRLQALSSIDTEDPEDDDNNDDGGGPKELPPGRNWDPEILSGIHANPSMNHLHIHVLSRDMVSPCMRKANHYLSFTSDFLVNLDQFPLAKNDHRRDYKHLPDDLVCWRCGKNFGRKMAKLKAHLDEELEAWKRI